MDLLWQRFLIGAPQTLPKHVNSIHFTNSELNALLSRFGGGNTLNDPMSITVLAEQVYSYNTWDELQNEFQQMFRDGLGNFFIFAWDMVQTKKRSQQVAV